LKTHNLASRQPSVARRQSTRPLHSPPMSKLELEPHQEKKASLWMWMSTTELASSSPLILVGTSPIRYMMMKESIAFIYILDVHKMKVVDIGNFVKAKPCWIRPQKKRTKQQRKKVGGRLPLHEKEPKLTE